MSLITLQIGQCGNQIGESFYDFIINEMINATPASQAMAGEVFFDYSESTKKYHAKSILVDMEPKVIYECLNSKKRENLWDYKHDMTFYKQEGSGNNWAFGYNIHGPACKDDISKKLRSELEKTDYLDALLFF